MSLAAGIDVGGTKCLGVVVDDRGSVVREVRKPTPTADQLVVTLASIVHELGEHTSVGLGVPGLISRDGVIRSSPNMTFLLTGGVMSGQLRLFKETWAI